MELEPYLFFDGKCEEALAFYARVFGGKPTFVQRFEGTPGEDHVPAADKQKIMHANFKARGLAFMASDGPRRADGSANAGRSQVSLSLSTRDEAEAERVFAALADGGTVTMPLEDTFWGAKFGTVSDKYGIDWMINCQKS